jgi:hypothetical protein
MTSFFNNCTLNAPPNPQSAKQNGGAASTKTACNRYGSNLGFERARSRGFEQKAVSTVRSPRQRVTFFKIGGSFGRNKSIRSTGVKNRKPDNRKLLILLNMIRFL